MSLNKRVLLCWLQLRREDVTRHRDGAAQKLSLLRRASPCGHKPWTKAAILQSAFILSGSSKQPSWPGTLGLAAACRVLQLLLCHRGALKRKLRVSDLRGLLFRTKQQHQHKPREKFTSCRHKQRHHTS